MTIKDLVPAPLLRIRRHRVAQRTVSRHKNMSRAEIEQELSRLYRESVGAELDLANPERFTEKIQWRKLYGIDGSMSRLSDKHAVREWVAEKIGENYLVPLLGVWEDVKEINFGELPYSFVMKTNNASGTNLIVRDRSRLNVREAKRQLSDWMDLEFGWQTFEMQYLPIVPKVIAEKYLDGPLPDYKFFCFDGEPYCIGVYSDRATEPKVAFLSTDWEILDFTRGKYRQMSEVPPRPSSLEEMLELARVLSSGYSHVRVDLYEYRDRPMFGEMTFTTASGLSPFVPDKWDYVLGSMWRLPARRQQ